MKRQIELLLEEIKDLQEQKLLKVGHDFVPRLTREDVLQPNDYPELENNPYFRYEEGILEGIHTVRAALLSLFSRVD